MPINVLRALQAFTSCITFIFYIPLKCEDMNGSHFSLKGQIKAKYFFIDFYHLQSGDFKISNEISI